MVFCKSLESNSGFTVCDSVSYRCSEVQILNRSLLMPPHRSLLHSEKLSIMYFLWHQITHLNQTYQNPTCNTDGEGFMSYTVINHKGAITSFGSHDVHSSYGVIWTNNRTSLFFSLLCPSSTFTFVFSPLSRCRDETSGLAMLPQSVMNSSRGHQQASRVQDESSILSDEAVALR